MKKIYFIYTLLIVMASNTSYVNNIIKHFKKEDIPCVISGGLGVELLREKYLEECPVLEKYPLEVNNIDIVYMKNTPYASKMIGNATRKEDSLRTTITYTTPEWVDINITMTRSSYMDIIFYKGLQIMHPRHLVNYYTDEFERTEIHDCKLFILNNILDIIKPHDKITLDKHNKIRIEKSVNSESLTMDSLMRLQTITE